MIKAKLVEYQLVMYLILEAINHYYYYVILSSLHNLFFAPPLISIVATSKIVNLLMALTRNSSHIYPFILARWTMLREWMGRIRRRGHSQCRRDESPRSQPGSQPSSQTQPAKLCTNSIIRRAMKNK